MKGLFALSCTLELSIIIFKYKGEHITLKILTVSVIESMQNYSVN